MHDRTTIAVPFDDRIIELSIPAENLGAVAGAGKPEVRILDPVRKAVRNCMNPPLHEMVRGRRTGLIVADATREVPLGALLDAVIPALQEASEIYLFIATGTHAPYMDGNREIAGAVREHAAGSGIDIREVIYHDCQGGAWTYAGRTGTHQNAIYVNPALEKCAVFVTFSEMKNHYFAGYSNPLKNFIPGLARQDSIMHNHALTMDERSTFGTHPLHPEPGRRDNPLALDIWEAYRLIVRGRPVFAVTTISRKQDVLWAAAGPVEAVVPETIREVDRRMSLTVGPAEYLVVSCGGYPNDESLYIAQRALELTRSGVRSGGEVLFLAGCRNGIGTGKSEENFYLPLTADIEKIISTPVEPYRLYAHKPVKFARLIHRLNKIHFYSRLPHDKVARIHMNPVDDPQAVIDRWLREKPEARIHVFPDGNKYAVYRSDDRI